tara:strand:- start:47 stop:577 length:531 start_codon:yes stop_codon:yes gene_type:complete
MKNYTEEEKEMINGVLEDYTSRPFGIMLIEFKEANGLTPKLEIGKWYKRTDYLGVWSESTDTYGFFRGRWMNNMLMCAASLAPATKEEVETAFIKEAEKRGLVEGVKVKCAHNLHEFVLGSKKPHLHIYKNGDTHLYSGCFLFHNGVWATIVKTTTKMSVAELEAAHGYTNLEITK